MYFSINPDFFSETQFNIFAISSHQRWYTETWSSLHLFFQSNSKPMWNSSRTNVEFRPSHSTKRIQIQRNGSSSGKNDTLRKTGKIRIFLMKNRKINLSEFLCQNPNYFFLLEIWIFSDNKKDLTEKYPSKLKKIAKSKTIFLRFLLLFSVRNLNFQWQ